MKSSLCLTLLFERMFRMPMRMKAAEIRGEETKMAKKMFIFIVIMKKKIFSSSSPCSGMKTDT